MNVKVKFMGLLLACCCATDSYGQFWNKEYSLGNLFGGGKKSKTESSKGGKSSLFGSSKRGRIKGYTIGEAAQSYPYYDARLYSGLQKAYLSYKGKPGYFRLQDVVVGKIDFSRITINSIPVSIANNTETGFIELWINNRYFLNLYGDEAVDLLRDFVSPHPVGNKFEKLSDFLMSRGARWKDRTFQFDPSSTRWRDTRVSQRIPVYIEAFDSIVSKDYSSRTFDVYKDGLPLPVGLHYIEKEPYLTDSIDNFTVRIDDVKKDSCVYFFAHVKGEWEGRWHVLRSDTLQARRVMSVLWGAFSSVDKRDFLHMKLNQLGFDKRKSKETAWVDWSPKNYKTEAELRKEAIEGMGMTEEQFDEMNRRLIKGTISALLTPSQTMFQQMGVEWSQGYIK